MEVTRGSQIESVHCAALAVADSEGRLTARLGSTDHVIYLRSSAKPLQAMAVIESGAAAAFGFTPRELAVIAGSHSSEPIHVETVKGILAKIGLDASALQCGTHVPFSRAVADEYRSSGRPFTALEHNCSGKHAGMLAAALAGGHDPATYLSPVHPVQQRIMGVVADLTGRMRDRIIVAVDGCGAPTLGVTLAEAARAFARLVAPDMLAMEHRESAARIVGAIRQHPEMIAGQGMMDTELSAYPSHNLIAKRGAEGVQCAAYVKDGVGHGIAAKVGDGDNGRARAALTMEVLRQLGLLSDTDLSGLTASAGLSIRNDAGREIGKVRAVFTLQRA